MMVVELNEIDENATYNMSSKENFSDLSTTSNDQYNRKNTAKVQRSQLCLVSTV